MTYQAKHPAAFINNIADEGTKAEAIEWLQKTWDELQDLKQEGVKDMELVHFYVGYALQGLVGHNLESAEIASRAFEIAEAVMCRINGQHCITCGRKYANGPKPGDYCCDYPRQVP